MTISIHGLTVSRGVAIGRAVLISSNHVDAPHYFIKFEDVDKEIARLQRGRDDAAIELERLLASLIGMHTKDAPSELRSLLEAHLMLLRDETLLIDSSVWITQRLYNAEWALASQFEVIFRQFDDMEDDYLRERAVDLEQILERILRAMHIIDDASQEDLEEKASRRTDGVSSELFLTGSFDTPLILVAHNISPADMIAFKQSVFAGFVTDVGGKTSHTAIVARSMDIPAVVGTRCGSALIRQDDWVIIDGDAGVVIVDPTQPMLEEYGVKKRQIELDRARLQRLHKTPAMTLDGQSVLLQANIELPQDAEVARRSGAIGIGLFRSEFLFMGRRGNLPNEQEQFDAYKTAVEGMQGYPVTIRTVDIGADKTLDNNSREDSKSTSALGLRAIRWSLSDPEMFLTQLRAILRAASFGPVKLLIPMLSHLREIHQTLSYVEQARRSLQEKNIPFGEIEIGAMIEIPAAALMCKYFLQYFDFLSIGTNDLIQYTLAIDRTDEHVAHLYDPLHPAVMQLIAHIIAECQAQNKDVSICGEMAGDATLTKLLLGFGLRNFSMHPSHLLGVKQEILLSDISKLEPWAQSILAAENPSELLLKVTPQSTCRT
jgi:phosphoenolpyruvate-protein phosphotransferase (PTS system enzyme I)